MKKINDENKKKIQIVGLVALGLLLLVVGVTYAIFELTGNGLIESIMIAMKPEQEEVTISYTEKDYIDLNEVFPMPDIEGIAQEGTSSVMSFTVTGPAGVNYALALYDITEGETLKEEYVKVHLTKDGVPASVFTSDEGKFISSFWQNHILGEINGYVILLNSFTDISTTHNYTLKAWIDESYDLDQEDISGGTSHGVETISETFSFKVKVLFKDEELALLTEKTPPVCGEITGDSTTWTGEDRTISIGCIDVGGCVEEIYSKTFNTTTEVGTITITDNAGNTTECPVNVYVDKKNYTITINNGDEGTLVSSATTTKVGDIITITGTGITDICNEFAYDGSIITKTSTGDVYTTVDKTTTTFTMPNYDVTISGNWTGKKYIYKNGDKCGVAWSCSAHVGLGSCQVLSDQIYMAALPNPTLSTGFERFHTTSTYDLTDWNTVTFVVNRDCGKNCQHFFYATTSLPTWYVESYEISKYSSTFGSLTTSIDVSSITTGYYIGVSAAVNRSYSGDAKSFLRVIQIYLSK